MCKDCILLYAQHENLVNLEHLEDLVHLVIMRGNPFVEVRLGIESLN